MRRDQPLPGWLALPVRGSVTGNARWATVCLAPKTFDRR